MSSKPSQASEKQNVPDERKAQADNETITLTQVAVTQTQHHKISMTKQTKQTQEIIKQTLKQTLYFGDQY